MHVQATQAHADARNLSRDLGQRGCRRLPAGAALALPMVAVFASAAEVDVSKLPAAASGKIDFARDIQPILEKSCLRCHGPERPKNHFRLDNRASALRGGENGVDIIPGQSAKSPLIHNVAGLVEDLQMPPKGKGEPLTAEQIGRLRAWIDQGVAWGAAEAAVKPQFSISPTVQWVTVRGDSQKFRERLWTKEGWSGGAEEFRYKQKLSEDSFVASEGHARFDQRDYKLTLSLEKTDVGFSRFGFDGYRKYFDDTGGYYAPFSMPSFNLNRDLHLDIGRVWTEFGLTLPDWPRLVVGYEYEFRNGSQSLLHWGPVTDAASGTTRNGYPAYEDLHEHAHVLKVDVTHDLRGVQLEDNFRAEFYHLDTQRFNDIAFQLGQTGPPKASLTDEGYRHFQANNTFRLEKQVNPWLFLSGGYFYNRLDGDAAFTQSSLLTPSLGLLPYSSASGIVLNQETHVFNANTLLGPWAGLTGFAGVQNEWTAQHGLGQAQTDEGDPTDPTTWFMGPALLSSDLGTFRVEENFGVRYTLIPRTVLFTDARFQQERISEFEQEQSEPNEPPPAREFIRDTAAVGDLKEYRAGFEVSPWQQVSVSAQYLRREKKTDYNNAVTSFGFLNVGYPGFINSRGIATDEADAKLSVRPTGWLKTTFTYKILATDYHTVTSPASIFDPVAGAVVLGNASPGGPVFAGNYEAQVCSVNAVLTPWRRLYVSSTFSYQPSRIWTANNGVAAVVPYRGDVYSVLTSGNYALTPSTGLRAAYSFSRADYGQHNEADGLPMGIVYDWHATQVGVKHQFKNGLTLNLQYAFYYYNEPSGGGANNFTAHALFAMLNRRLP